MAWIRRTETMFNMHAVRLVDTDCISRRDVLDEIDSARFVGVTSCLSEQFSFLTAHTRRLMGRRFAC